MAVHVFSDIAVQVLHAPPVVRTDIPAFQECPERLDLVRAGLFVDVLACAVADGFVVERRALDDVVCPVLIRVDG